VKRVASSVTCVLTRFALRSIVDAPVFWLAYRQVRSEASKKVPGLLKTALLREGFRTFYTLSVWSDAAALSEFGTQVRSHVPAGNWIFTVARKAPRGIELWSTQWLLTAVGRNLEWGDFDLVAVLAGQSNEGRSGAKAGGDRVGAL
jgi:hypothetical protein